MDMDYMTWQEMCGNGVGTGRTVLIMDLRRGVIRVVRLGARTECFAGTVGTTTPSIAGWHTASTVSGGQATLATPAGSGPFCPQVSELGTARAELTGAGWRSPWGVEEG
jgi:hypothetical protein